MSTSGFYKFRNNTGHTRGFTWAISIVSRSEMVNEVCPECGGIKHYPSGAFDVILERGSKYPDILGCGAYPFLILSEATIRAFRDAGITCFHTYPVGIAEVRSKKLRDVMPPAYFRVEIEGRCEIDLAASGAESVYICPRCQRLVTRPSLLPGYRMVPGSWDGCALFRDVRLLPCRSFCTGLVLDIARQRRLTNFRFEPMEGPFDYGGKGIDYLKAR